MKMQEQRAAYAASAKKVVYTEIDEYFGYRQHLISRRKSIIVRKMSSLSISGGIFGNINDFAAFKQQRYIIVANRWSEELRDVQ